VVLDGISTFDARCSGIKDTRIDRPSTSHAYFSRFLLVRGILEGLDVSSPRTSEYRLPNGRRWRMAVAGEWEALENGRVLENGSRWRMVGAGEM
jgi:hypothetical protein